MALENMPEEVKTQLAKAGKRIETANKIRLAFMFIAIVLLVVIYFGNKIWEGNIRYDGFVTYSYSFLLWDILFLFIATVAKLIMTVRYNKIIKRL